MRRVTYRASSRASGLQSRARTRSAKRRKRGAYHSEWLESRLSPSSKRTSSWVSAWIRRLRSSPTISPRSPPKRNRLAPLPAAPGGLTSAAHGLPLGRVVVLVAGLENDPGLAYGGGDALRVGEGGGQGLLANDVEAPRRRLLDQRPVRRGRRADVAEIQRLPLQQLLGAVVGGGGREEGARRFQVRRREVRQGDDLDLLPEALVPHPLRRVPAQRDVAGSEQR